jgi:hypothetical protein
MPFGKLHQRQASHRVAHQSQSFLKAFSFDVLQQVVSELPYCVRLGVRTLPVVPGVDEEGVEAGCDDWLFDDGPEVAGGAHESMVNYQVSAATVVSFEGGERYCEPNARHKHEIMQRHYEMLAFDGVGRLCQ